MAELPRIQGLFLEAAASVDDHFRQTEGFETADRMTAHVLTDELSGPDRLASDGQNAVPAVQHVAAQLRCASWLEIGEYISNVSHPRSSGRLGADAYRRMNFTVASSRPAQDSIHEGMCVQSPSRTKGPCTLALGGWKGVVRMRKTRHLLGGFVRGQWAGDLEPDDAINALALGLIAASIVLLASLVL
jgi:hypothetical protein